MAFIDLSHTVEHGMTTYPGLPGPIICDYLSREASRAHYGPGVEFQIGKIEMVANTGTYLDSPFHRYAHGKDLAQLPLESLADLDAVVVRIPGGAGRAITHTAFESVEIEGKAVRNFKFFAVPAKVAGFGSWPVRAFGHVLPSNDRLGLSRRRSSLS